MRYTRRAAIVSLGAAAITSAAQNPAQNPETQRDRGVASPEEESDQKLPNGKSQKDAIAEEQHKQALKDAEQLVSLSEQVKDEIQKAGNYVVPLTTVKKTEDIEKLARKIRGRLRG